MSKIGDAADGIKIFLNSVAHDHVVTVSSNLDRLIIAEPRGAGKLVFAHGLKNQGFEPAIQSRSVPCRPLFPSMIYGNGLSCYFPDSLGQRSRMHWLQKHFEVLTVRFSGIEHIDG
jgi:hypothetical protein